MNEVCKPRIAELVTQFSEIGATQMRGLPLYNENLEVEALGFERHGEHWLGVLITPWFMNLMLLPLRKTPLDNSVIARKTLYEFPAGCFSLICGGDKIIGQYHALSLQSPLLHFTRQAAARAEAEQRLATIMTAPQAESEAGRMKQADNTSRRAFLRGRAGA